MCAKTCMLICAYVCMLVGWTKSPVYVLLSNDQIKGDR